MGRFVSNKAYVDSGPAVSEVDFGRIVNKPSTLAGYGITDANVTTVSFANITGKPTTMLGWGINEVNFNALVNRPTTLAGYGITDGATSGLTIVAVGRPEFPSGLQPYIPNVQGNPSYPAGLPPYVAKAIPFTTVADKPTTLAGYGITDTLPSYTQKVVVTAPVNIVLNQFVPGKMTDVILEIVNGGSALVTFPFAINWALPAGGTTTSFSTYMQASGRNPATLQSNGSDFFVFWSSDAIDIYGKLI